jgi:hypothetical protein
MVTRKQICKMCLINTQANNIKKYVVLIFKYQITLFEGDFKTITRWGNKGGVVTETLIKR